MLWSESWLQRTPGSRSLSLSVEKGQLGLGGLAQGSELVSGTPWGVMGMNNRRSERFAGIFLNVARLGFELRKKWLGNGRMEVPLT